MNERIKEILDQAQGSIDPMDLNANVFDRFAELIVKECIDTINGVPNGYRDYRNQIEDAMREACVDAVKQKFGVE